MSKPTKTRRTPTQKDIDAVRKRLAVCERTVEVIASYRERLRTEVSDLTAIIDSLDSAAEDFESGKHYIESALGTMSQYL